MLTKQQFSCVVKKYIDTVFRVALNYTKSVADAEDLTQDVFLALMQEEGKLTTKEVNGKTYYVMDEQVFKAYGEQYTEDSSVFYDNVKTGQMVKPFENWMFADTRIEGEVTYPSAVETDYGFHIMLYRGDEKPAWSYSIKVSLAEGRYDKWLEDLTAGVNLTVNNVANQSYLDMITG